MLLYYRYMEGTIATKTSQLNQLFLGRTKNDELRSSLAREGLLDALVVLYEECCHDQLKRDKHVAAFVQKCEYGLWDIQMNFLEKNTHTKKKLLKKTKQR